MDAPQTWWKDAVVYQIYPASFKDSNNDGLGDIPGITQSLDYIQSLGVDVIWVCPMYESPQVDMGYDISDYESVYAPYGTVEDMQDLIVGVHRRGMRIILDLVINHTSDKHAWFEESRSSKDDPKRDWYIWRPAKVGADGTRMPPNNWRGNFGGSVWQWDEPTQEYYLHLFCPEQPDLNWENEETRQAIYRSAMTFWLEKGIDGFRIDTVNMYSKPSLADAPLTDPSSPWQDASQLYCNGPHMDKYLEEMNDILSKYDAMSVGECPCTPDMQRVIDYVSADKKRLNMVFQFDSVDVGMGKRFKYDTTPFNYTLSDIKSAICRTQGLLDGTDAWTTSFIENHDQARSISRFGNDSPAFRARSGKMLSMLTASLSGTLFVYQGQEIGMINLPPEVPMEEYKDVDALNFYNEMKERYDDPAIHAEYAKTLQHLARDHARTPMQWTSAKNAGFTSEEIESWMIANPSAQEGINVAEESKDKDSVLHFWRRVIQTRKANADVLVHGKFQPLDADNPKVFTFLKSSSTSHRRALVTCNFSDAQQSMPQIPEIDSAKMHVLLTNIEADGRRTDSPMGEQSLSTMLEPWECRLYLLP